MKKFLKNFDKNYLILAAASVLVLFVFLRATDIVGFDIPYHIGAVTALRDAIKSGHFDFRIYPQSLKRLGLRRGAVLPCAFSSSNRLDYGNF